MNISLSTQQLHQRPTNISKSALLIGWTLGIHSNLPPLWLIVHFVLQLVTLQLLHFTTVRPSMMENVLQPLMRCKFRTSIAKWKMKGTVLKRGLTIVEWTYFRIGTVHVFYKWPSTLTHDPQIRLNCLTLKTCRDLDHDHWSSLARGRPLHGPQILR